MDSSQLIIVTSDAASPTTYLLSIIKLDTGLFRCSVVMPTANHGLSVIDSENVVDGLARLKQDIETDLRAKNQAIGKIKCPLGFKYVNETYLEIIFGPKLIPVPDLTLEKMSSNQQTIFAHLDGAKSILLMMILSKLESGKFSCTGFVKLKDQNNSLGTLEASLGHSALAAVDKFIKNIKSEYGNIKLERVFCRDDEQYISQAELELVFSQACS